MAAGFKAYYTAETRAYRIITMDFLAELKVSSRRRCHRRRCHRRHRHHHHHHHHQGVGATWMTGRYNSNNIHLHASYVQSEKSTESPRIGLRMICMPSPSSMELPQNCCESSGSCRQNTSDLHNQI